MTTILRVLFACTALLAGLAPADGPEGKVVFVCEHGSVKSLMASEYFNQAAGERSLPYRAVARGIEPDERVPGKIVDRLREESIDASKFHPQAVSAADVAGASRVVAIGIDVRELPAAAGAEEWNDVPPASVDYAAARQSLMEHVNRLLDELAAEPRP